MAEIILVTGGSRSGKSRFSLELAEKRSENRLFIATCPKIDNELDERISLHAKEREGRGWDTIEEEIELAKIIEENTTYDVILVDCLTLWVNNLLFKNNGAENFNCKLMDEFCEKLILAVKEFDGVIIFVTNEIGSGIVPDNKISRLYRDLVGSCNQFIAKEADKVFLVSCGIPLQLK